jgi:hypothetical protein
VYERQHAAVLSDVVGVLHRVGLRPGRGCVLGDGLATVDIGVMLGEPPRQVSGGEGEGEKCGGREGGGEGGCVGVGGGGGAVGGRRRRGLKK